MRAALVLIAALAQAPAAHAADACQDFIRLKQLPQDFKTVSLAAMGPAEMRIARDGKCLCNNLPAVQRSLGQAEPSEVDWVCQPDDTNDKGK